MNNTIELQKHLNIANPTTTFELTKFDEAEAWQFNRDGIVTYDEADHMVDGMSLFESRIVLASYECGCDLCGSL